MIKQLITTIDTALTKLEEIFGISHLSWYALDNHLNDGFEVSGDDIRWWVDDESYSDELRQVWNAQGHTLVLCYDNENGLLFKLFNDDNKREEF